MSQWFRMYAAMRNDPKVQRLPDGVFKAWVNLLCLAAERDGALPSISDIAFDLRLPEAKARKVIATLQEAGLIDVSDEGMEPHNWRSRQYKSDGSNDRVQRYRQKRRDAGLPVLSDYSKFKPGLIKRDGEQCIYCAATAALVVDHMVPIALGGSDDEDNLGLSCKPCNSGKAGRTPELASMTIRVTSAANALRRYRDKAAGATVSVTPPEAETESETEQKEAVDERAPPMPGRFGEVYAELESILNLPAPLDGARIHSWLAAGANPEIDIYPTVRRLLGKKGGAGISSLSYFDRAIADAIATRTRPLPAGTPNGNKQTPRQAATASMIEVLKNAERGLAEIARSDGAGAPANQPGSQALLQHAQHGSE